MPLVSILEARCDNSPFCPARRACPKGAIVPNGIAFKVVEEKCTGCGACMRVCPMGAIQFK
jgi:Fe-S-cluster-containing hydrogenase component 2